MRLPWGIEARATDRPSSRKQPISRLIREPCGCLRGLLSFDQLEDLSTPCIIRLRLVGCPKTLCTGSNLHTGALALTCASIAQVTIWGGVFPIVVNWWAALGLTVYYVATNNVLFYVRSVQHVQALWFANCANSILWWTYTKACMRALMTLMGLSNITFKTTLKV